MLIFCHETRKGGQGLTLGCSAINDDDDDDAVGCNRLSFVCGRFVITSTFYYEILEIILNIYSKQAEIK
jgi:hypothetical protein